MFGDDFLRKVPLVAFTCYRIPIPPTVNSIKTSVILDGENLQHFSMRSPEHVNRAMELLLKALSTFERISDDMRARDTRSLLEDKSLVMELDAIFSGPWDGEPIYTDSIRTLRPVLERIETPRSFTNGDHQPGNFLTDGEKIVGYVDFEYACFRDPLMGIAKYPVYDLHPLNKAGFVDLYLKRNGFTSAEFSARVALMCLATLQRGVSVQPRSSDEKKYKEHVLKLLVESVTLSAELV